MNEDFYSTSWSPLQKMLAKATLNLFIFFLKNYVEAISNPVTKWWLTKQNQ